MNRFDLSILTYLNSFANRHPHLDVLITHMQHDNLVKGGVLLAVFWFFWFQNESESNRNATQEKIVAGFIAMIVGLFLARTLTHLLPFRVRPFSNPELHFVIPAWDGNLPLAPNWSAFPSDHAVVWFSIAATIYLINESIGWMTLAYVSLLGLGRIYEGYHHPTDILAGAALGIALVLLLNLNRFQSRFISPIVSWSKARPSWFYATAFLATYEISNMFNEVRAIGGMGWHAIKLFL